jgi:hypothetical protein
MLKLLNNQVKVKLKIKNKMVGIFSVCATGCMPLL